MNNKISISINNIKVVLTILVVYIHFPGPFTWDKYNLGIKSIYSALDFCSISIDILTKVAVPAFFVMSGFLFFKDEFSFETYKAKIHRRISSLLVPYMLWNFIPFLIVIGLKVLGCIIKGNNWGGIIMYINDTDWLDVFTGYKNTYPLNPVLWFIRDLMISSVLSPLVYCIAKRKFLFIFAIILFVIVPNISCNIYSYSSFVYFLIGAYVSTNKLAILNRNCIFCSIFICSFLCLLFFGKGVWNNFLFLMLTMSFICLCFIVSQKIDINKNIALVKYSFWIFVTHWVFGPFLPNYDYKMLGYIGWIYMIIKPLIVIALMIVLYEFLNRYNPCLLKILMGKR